MENKDSKVAKEGEKDKCSTILETANVDCTVTAEHADAVLESIDSCVVCADGVQGQHQYERQISERDRRDAEHGLSVKEAALIRLQLLEDKNEANEAGVMGAFPDMIDLNICGNDTDDEKPPYFFPPTPSTTGNSGGGGERPTTPVVPGSDAESSRRSSMSSGILARESASGVASPATTPTSGAHHCAICFDEPGEASSPRRSTVTFAHLPCCGSDGREERSSTKICTTCVVLLSNPTSDGSQRIGRCPRCRSWIAVSTDKMPHVEIEPVEAAGTCQICNQLKAHLVDDNHQVCDACFLGRRKPLMYECKECHVQQRIPHPMYRYQPTLTEFGTTSWACQGSCQNFTMWRILPDQVRDIPAGDAPESWGEDYIAVARSRVMEARNAYAENGGNGADASASYKLQEACVIQ